MRDWISAWIANTNLPLNVVSPSSVASAITTDEETSSEATSTCLGGDLGQSAVSAIPSHISVPKLLTLFVLLGVVARAVRFYLCFPLWDDESFLCVNFIDRSYAELLRPLDYHQVAPVLFLWIERAAVQLLGYSEYSLRLFAFVCSIASVFLFRRVAERLLSGPALVFAVAIFAVSYPGIRYAAEAKPYGSDMFVSLVMLSLTVDWLQQRDVRWLWWLTMLMPLAVGVSYPAAFAGGGLSLVVGWTLWRERGTRKNWLAWIAWNLTLVASFVFWFWFAGRTQSGAEGEFMGDFWRLHFPPVREPWKLPFWMLWTHASDFLAYPLGGPNWASSITLLFCFAGLWRMTQKRQFVLLGLLFGPQSLHFLAAALQRYPYGGHVKFSQYLAPMICCIIAVGVVQCMEWWARRGHSIQRAFALDCAILAAIGVGVICRDAAIPYKTRSDYRARAFAQAFWFGIQSAEEVLCLKSDLGLDFVPEQHRELSWSAQFRCNRAIEVSRAHLRPADLSRVAKDHPLRCVMYRDARFGLDQQSLDRWLADMKTHYELVAHESLPFPRFAKNDTRLVAMEYVDSYKFIPRNGEPTPSSPSPLADRRHELPR